MQNTAVLNNGSGHHSHDGGTRTLDHLAHVIEHAAHLLPAQGPITVFIHHNTLHAFEDLSFEQGVVRGAKVFGCHPFLTEDRYRTELDRGRIRVDDLRAVLRKDLGPRADESVLRFGSRLDLRLAMLEHPFRSGPTEELLWFVAETDALRKVRSAAPLSVRGRLIEDTRHWVMREVLAGKVRHLGGQPQPLRVQVPPALQGLFDRFGTEVDHWDLDTWEAFALQALWRICCDGVRSVPPPPAEAEPLVRHRDLLLAATGEDADLWVNPVLIRFTAAFLDQGVAHWGLPRRELGYFRAFCDLYGRPGGPPDRWMRGLSAELARLTERNIDPLESIHESLAILGVPEAEWDSFLSATLLALRGWGGIIQHLETRGDRVARAAPTGSLIGFIAVRLMLDRFAVAHAARETLGFDGPLAELRSVAKNRVGASEPPSVEQRAFPLFQLAQILGWSPGAMAPLATSDWATLLAEVETFDGFERRRLFHLAYERRFRNRTLDAVTLHPSYRPARPGPPRFQVVNCLDEREESFRRHLEEVAPECETFGAAGFFNVPIYYKGSADAHYVPLCPIVIRPKHWVAESVDEKSRLDYERRTLWRRWFGWGAHQFHIGSRGLAVGAMLAGFVGVLASVPLVVRTMFPRLAAHARHWLGGFVQTPKKTRLEVERREAEPGPENGHLGFSIAEMTDSAERLLRDIGLTDGFARMVCILGHGSHSMNNPHESAHDCGACGGAIGGPNARAVAHMFNDPRVRAGLAARGLPIPADTVFVGGLHNTCNEYVKFFDTDRTPESHAVLFAEVTNAMDATLDRNAHERARRFDSAPLNISFAGARQHMDARAEDLAQVRPEWGHATNAICVVGRRSRTRGLFFDRRAFLTSYDPTRDDDNTTVLIRLLSAAVPVCAGINLEYYFCHTDPSGYGCGTKLPHNITSLLGVMDGAASDLRTGLPWQMVEIHETVRLLFVIETTAEKMQRIMDKFPGIGGPIKTGWVQLALLDPDSNAVQVYRDGAFQPYTPEVAALPRAASSTDWYGGWRDFLEFAEIGV